MIGVTSASAAPDSKYGRARWHLIRIEREAAGWQFDVELRALQQATAQAASLTESSSFHSGQPLAMVA